jgi:hypothetical protein
LGSGRYGRQASPRRLGHGGRPVGTSIPLTVGSTSREGIARERATAIAARPVGVVCAKLQIG